VFEDEERHAEDVIGFRLLLRATVGEGALAFEIFAIPFGGETQIEINMATASGWSASNSRRKKSFRSKIL
jgi:hypothetical protein